MLEKLFIAALAAVFLCGRWALHRSDRWQAAGLCAGCGAEAPDVDVVGNHFCQVCAPTALKNSRAGGQFFAFMGTILMIGLSALLLESGGGESDELIRLRTRVGVGAIFFMAVVWWIHRGMKRKEIR